MIFTTAIAIVLAWGALAFGCVYPWGYMPLAVASAALGIAALARRPAHVDLQLNRRLAWGAAAVAAAIALQIVPLPGALVSLASPAAEALRARMDLAYSAALASGADAGAARPLSLAPETTLTALLLFSSFALLLVGLARGLAARDVRSLAASLVVLGTVLALVAIVQRASGINKVYGFWEPEFGRISTWHGGGPFMNRNHFAGWMLMALSAGLGYFAGLVARGTRGTRPGWRGTAEWFATKDANRAVAVAAGLLVMALALVLTLSRSGVTCLMFSLVLTGAVVFRRQPGKSKRRILAGYIAFLAFLSASWAGLDAIVARFAKAASDFPDRLGAWHDTLRIFGDFPIAGAGLGSYDKVMFFYQSTDPLTRFDYAHNDYLQLLAEGGLLVFIPSLVFVALFVREVRRRFRDANRPATAHRARVAHGAPLAQGVSEREGVAGFGPDGAAPSVVSRARRPLDPAMYWIRAGAVTGLVAIGLQEIGEYSLQMPGNTVLFVVLMAMAVGKAPHRRNTKA